MAASQTDHTNCKHGLFFFQEASPESSTLQESWDDSNDYGDDFIPPESSGSLKMKVVKRGGKLYRVCICCAIQQVSQDIVLYLCGCFWRSYSFQSYSIYIFNIYSSVSTQLHG